MQSKRNEQYQMIIDATWQLNCDSVADKEIAAKSRRSCSCTHPEIVDARGDGRLEDDP